MTERHAEATVVPFAPMFRLGGGAVLRISTGGLELRTRARAPFRPVSLEELRRWHPADEQVWRWLAERGYAPRRGP